MTRLTLFAIASFAVSPMLIHAQETLPTLQITSPATGTVVQPGESISVRVNPVRVGFAPPAQSVFLMGEGIGVSAAHGAPFQFTFQIPESISPGSHNLYAAGQSASRPGISALSSPIVLEVARLDAPVRVVVEPSALFLQINPGSNPSASSQRLRLYFEYADGTRAPVSPVIAGRNTIQIRTGTGVVSVDIHGLVTPKTAGFDQILIECLTCSGESAVPEVPAVVQEMRIAVTQNLIQVAGAAETFNLSVTTDGVPYRATGESWLRAVRSLSSDNIHWTTEVAVDRNPSSKQRIGTLRLSLATGETQDVVAYQSGSN